MIDILATLQNWKKERNIQKHLFRSKYGIVFGKMWFSSVNWTNFANIREKIPLKKFHIIEKVLGLHVKMFKE